MGISKTDGQERRSLGIELEGSLAVITAVVPVRYLPKRCEDIPEFLRKLRLVLSELLAIMAKVTSTSILEI